MAPEHDDLHDRLLRIVKSLPGAFEDRPWGSVHCKVAGKIFVGWGRREDGAMSVGFKTDKQLQAMLVASDPRFTIAAYVGKHGWVDMKLDPTPDWREVTHFIVDSFRMIAPKKLVKELDAMRGGAGAPPAAPKSAAPKGAAPKAARKPTSSNGVSTKASPERATPKAAAKRAAPEKAKKAAGAKPGRARRAVDA